MTDEILGDELARELGDVGRELERIRDLGDGVGRTLANAFRGAALNGRSLNGVLGDIGRSLSDIALRAALRPVEVAVSGLVENLFAATNPVLAGVTPFAKGGVIAAPTYFSHGGGFGLAGEAGPEAVLPLKRGPDGTLGVAAGGAGGQGAVTINFHVTAADAGSFRQSEAEISAMLLRAARRGLRGN